MSELVIEVDTPEDVAKHILDRAARFPGAVEQALWEEASITMHMSMRQCPVDTGRMRATGPLGSWSGGSERPADEVVQMEVGADEVKAEIGYYTNYAIFPHELGTHTPPSKTKFLEDPVNERVDAFPAGLAARVEKYITEGL